MLKMFFPLFSPSHGLLHSLVNPALEEAGWGIPLRVAAGGAWAALPAVDASLLSARQRQVKLVRFMSKQICLPWTPPCCGAKASLVGQMGQR